jgi:hypothetical protein
MVTVLTCDNYNWCPPQKELVYWPILPIPGFKRVVYTIPCSELQQCCCIKNGVTTEFKDVLLLNSSSTPPAGCLPTTQAAVQECYVASICFAHCSHRSQSAIRADPCWIIGKQGMRSYQNYMCISPSRMLVPRLLA